MIVALPPGEAIMKALRFDHEIAAAWRKLTGKTFNSNPDGYMAAVIQAGREGVLATTKELLRKRGW